MPQSNNGNNFASIFINKVYAQESLKVNSINFDNSDSIIFLGTSGNDESELKITKKVLSEPDRVFFDIENAIITFPNSTFELKNSRLTKVRIAQNSVDPNVVRIVIWNNPNYDSSQIKVLQIKNNIIIKLSNEIPLQQYLSQIYKETKESSVEYYDKAVVIPEEKQPVESDEIFNKVQQAFNEDKELVRPNIEQKQARLKSRFFLENVLPKNGNILVSGIGVINVEKPMFLTEPNRVVFDFPNTIVLQELRDKEFALSETETIKIGQFEPSKARIVIKTDTPELYTPIYSTNLQTLLIANEERLSTVNIETALTELAYFKEQKINSTIDVINIMFSNPVIYSIKRDRERLKTTFFNLSNFNASSFNSIAQANKTGFFAKQIGANSYEISFPISSDTLVDCYETLNASQLRFVFTKKTSLPSVQEPIINPQGGTTKIPTPVKEPTVKPTPKPKKEGIFSDLLDKPKKKEQKPKQSATSISKIKNKVVVIDPGHGGLDTGALRGLTLEKDLTLSIALKVKEILKEAGMKKVLMTRNEDKTLSLEDRVEYANKKDADIYVSIHINASVKSEIKGIETHYYTQSGYKVAQVIHEELLDNVDAEDRGLFKSKFYVINHTKAPAVLLELGFISNEQERSSLTSEKRQTDSAQAIADGIINYLLRN